MPLEAAAGGRRGRLPGNTPPGLQASRQHARPFRAGACKALHVPHARSPPHHGQNLTRAGHALAAWAERTRATPATGRSLSLPLAQAAVVHGRCPYRTVAYAARSHRRCTVLRGSVRRQCSVRRSDRTMIRADPPRRAPPRARGGVGRRLPGDVGPSALSASRGARPRYAWRGAAPREALRETLSCAGGASGCAAHSALRGAAGGRRRWRLTAMHSHRREGLAHSRRRATRDMRGLPASRDGCS